MEIGFLVPIFSVKKKDHPKETGLVLQFPLPQDGSPNRPDMS